MQRISIGGISCSKIILTSMHKENSKTGYKKSEEYSNIFSIVLLINLVYINNTSFIGKFEFLRRQLMLAHKLYLPNMINSHRWLKHFTNISRKS